MAEIYQPQMDADERRFNIGLPFQGVEYNSSMTLARPTAAEGSSVSAFICVHLRLTNRSLMCLVFVRHFQSHRRVPRGRSYRNRARFETKPQFTENKSADSETPASDGRLSLRFIRTRHRWIAR